MQANLQAIALIIREFESADPVLAISEQYPITDYMDPYEALRVAYGESKQTQFKIVDNGEKTLFYFLIDGQTLSKGCNELDWLNLNQLAETEPLKSPLGDVNHSVINDLIVYLRKLKDSNLEKYLWE